LQLEPTKAEAAARSLRTLHSVAPIRTDGMAGVR
jgi:hypothetical protein